jgi:hypothetical protein
MLAVRALALVTAMLLAWPAAAFGGYQITCRMMGRVAKKCCCAHVERSTNASPELKARGCCEVSPSSDHDGVPAVRGSELRLDAPVTAMTVPVFVGLPELLGRTLDARPFMARAPPPATTPIFLQNCSLLS